LNRALDLDGFLLAIAFFIIIFSLLCHSIAKLGPCPAPAKLTQMLTVQHPPMPAAFDFGPPIS